MAIGKIEGHTIGIASVHFRPAKPHHIATGGFDGRLCIHEGPPFRLRKSIAAFPPESAIRVTCVRYSPDGTSLALTGSNGALSLYNGVSYELIRYTHISGLQIGRCRTVEIAKNLLGVSWRPHGGYFAVIDEALQLRLIREGNLQQIQSVPVGDSPDDLPVRISVCM